MAVVAVVVAVVVAAVAVVLVMVVARVVSRMLGVRRTDVGREGRVEAVLNSQLEVFG